MKVDTTFHDLIPVERWAMAYTAPNPDHFIAASIIGSTRSKVWDQILGFTFNRLESGGEYWYIRYISYQPRNGVRSSVSRHQAIKTLRKRGIRVIRVKVVVA